MKKTVLVLLISALPFLTGCFGVSSYFDSVKDDILQNMTDRFEEDTEFALGPVTLSVAEFFVDFSDDVQAQEIIDAISRVQVGVYKRHYSGGEVSRAGIMKNIDRRMRKFGWKYIVKNYKQDEVSAVYVGRTSDWKLSRMFVVSLNKEELVLVQLDGDLDRVFEMAVREKGLTYN